MKIKHLWQTKTKSSATVWLKSLTLGLHEDIKISNASKVYLNIRLFTWQIHCRRAFSTFFTFVRYILVALRANN